MFRLIQTKPFLKAYQKLISGNLMLEKKIEKTLEALSEDPYQLNLHTHKVNISEIGIVHSSRVTGDLRILWEFLKKDEVLILLLKLGGHSGKHSVYK